METRTLYLFQIALVLCFTAADCFGTAYAQQNEDGTIKPVVEIQKEDYAVVHQQYKTILMKKAGSPQPSQPFDSVDIPPKGATQVFYKSGELTLKAWMNKPSNNNHSKSPAVVFLHGGFAFGKGDWDMTKPFRDSGFIVITPMLRGENGQSGTFTMFYDEVNDAVATITYAKAQPFIDKNRVYLAGHSVGGTITLLTALTSASVQKAASFSGSPDQIIYCKYGIDPKMIPFDTMKTKEFIVRSPLAYATSFKIPVRIFYGTKEPHFRLSSQLTSSYAKQKGLDVEAIEVEGGHESAVADEMRRAIQFFNQRK